MREEMSTARISFTCSLPRVSDEINGHLDDADPLLSFRPHSIHVFSCFPHFVAASDARDELFDSRFDLFS
jgi:hypothetical protein